MSPRQINSTARHQALSLWQIVTETRDESEFHDGCTVYATGNEGPYLPVTNSQQWTSSQTWLVFLSRIQKLLKNFKSLFNFHFYRCPAVKLIFNNQNVGGLHRSWIGVWVGGEVQRRGEALSAKKTRFLLPYFSTSQNIFIAQKIKIGSILTAEKITSNGWAFS